MTRSTKKLCNSSNNTLSFVRVPKTSSDRSFQNSKKWLDIAIKIAASKHETTYEAAYRIANHHCRIYKDSVLAAWETRKIVVCEPMSATAFSAMMCVGKISGTGELEVKKHLSAHLGPGFCPTQTKVSMLSEGHGVVSSLIYFCVLVETLVTVSILIFSMPFKVLAPRSLSYNQHPE